MHRGIAVTLVVAGVFALSGCTTGPSQYSVFDREPTTEGAVPAVVEGEQIDTDLGETRFLGEHDGKRFWVSHAARGTSVCLVFYPDDGAWFLACGGATGLVASSMDDLEYHLVPDGTTPPEEATVISENLYVTGG